MDDVKIVFRLADGGYEVFLEGVAESDDFDTLPIHAKAAVQAFQEHVDLEALEEACTAVMN